MRIRTSFFRLLKRWLLLSMLGIGLLGGAGLSVRAAPGQQTPPSVIINEVAWGGTVASPETDEWIELYNPGSTPINFVDANGQWTLVSEGDSPKINIKLSGSIGGQGYYLLERQNDSVVNTIIADQIYFGPGNILDDTGDTLLLINSNGIEVDSVNSNGGPWPAGTVSGYGSMERYGVFPDSDSIWVTNPNPDPTLNVDFRGNPIFGTPKNSNWATTIKPLTTTTITNISPEPSIPDQQVTVSVTVSGGPTTPTGTVRVSSADTTGVNTNCTITLANNGTGSCNLNFTTIGKKTITASYNNPTSNHQPSIVTKNHEVVTPISTTTTITNITPDPALVGKDVSVFVSVEANNVSTTPTGTVSITGANTNCTITLVTDGTGSCNVQFSSIGAKKLTATYNGNGAYTPSEDVASVDAFLSSTTTITEDSPDPSRTNESVKVTVTVTGENTVPTGEVDITGASSNCKITLEEGTGSCNVNFTSSGTKTLKATYTGDSAHAISSDTETHSVTFVYKTPVPPPAPLKPILGISEFLPRPGYDWNNDGIVDVFDEFIEIINAGSIDVNLSAYRVDDEENLGSSPYALPNLTLKPGERAVFYASETGILLSDAGDTVRLLRGSTVIDAYTYSVVRYPDQSYCRIPDRLGYWYHPCFPTPNNPNSLTGNIPLSSKPASGYQPPVCLFSDTTPAEFVYAECEAGGAEIWNRQYWDGADDAERLKLGEQEKWETIFE